MLRLIHHKLILSHAVSLEIRLFRHAQLGNGNDMEGFDVNYEKMKLINA